MPAWNQIGDFAYAQIIARRLTTPDPNPAPGVEPGVFPTMALEVDRPEWKWLGGTRSMIGFGTIAADVANFSAVSFFNPAGSKTLCVITQVSLSSGAGLSFFRITARAGTLGITAPTDMRWPQAAPNYNSVMNVVQENPAALLPSMEMMRFANTSTSNTWMPMEIILPPGTGISAFTRAINSALSMGAQWYERAAQPSELP